MFQSDRWERRHRDQEDHSKLEAQGSAGYVRDRLSRVTESLVKGGSVKKSCSGKSNVIINTE